MVTKTIIIWIEIFTINELNEHRITAKMTSNEDFFRTYVGS
jgi:hypothetical protein